MRGLPAGTPERAAYLAELAALQGRVGDQAREPSRLRPLPVHLAAPAGRAAQGAAPRRDHRRRLGQHAGRGEADLPGLRAADAPDGGRLLVDGLGGPGRDRRQARRAGAHRGLRPRRRRLPHDRAGDRPHRDARPARRVRGAEQRRLHVDPRWSAQADQPPHRHGVQPPRRHAVHARLQGTGRVVRPGVVARRVGRRSSRTSSARRSSRASPRSSRSRPTATRRARGSRAGGTSRSRPTSRTSARTSTARCAPASSTCKQTRKNDAPLREDHHRHGTDRHLLSRPCRTSSAR